MKNKFIIGDIVKEGVIEFINFSGNEYAIKKEGEFSIVTTDPTPLPLTEDILKGHGFEETGFTNNADKPFYENKKLCIEVYISESFEEGSFMIGCNRGIGIFIKYVHELQHFLFGLGQEL